MHWESQLSRVKYPIVRWSKRDWYNFNLFATGAALDESKVSGNPFGPSKNRNPGKVPRFRRRLARQEAASKMEE